jgi:hypothetical protein
MKMQNFETILVFVFCFVCVCVCVDVVGAFDGAETLDDGDKKWQ